MKDAFASFREFAKHSRLGLGCVAVEARNFPVYSGRFASAAGMARVWL